MNKKELRSYIFILHSPVVYLQVSGWINWIFINSTRWRHSVQGCKDAEAPRHALKLMTSGCGRIVWRREKAIIHSDGAAWYILKKKLWRGGGDLLASLLFWHLCELELGWNHENLYNLITHKMLHSHIKTQAIPSKLHQPTCEWQKDLEAAGRWSTCCIFWELKIGFLEFGAFPNSLFTSKKIHPFPPSGALWHALILPL